jgi:hypothetical protein
MPAASPRPKEGWNLDRPKEGLNKEGLNLDNPPAMHVGSHAR